MAVIVPGIKTRLKYQGVFHSTALYRMLIEYLKDEDYCDEDTYKYIETYYHEKHSSDPREAKTMWIWWRMGKPEEAKAEEAYYWFDLDITFHFRFIKDVEVMREGEKMRAQKGEVEMFIECNLVLDRNNKWERHWLLKHLHPLFYMRLWKKQKEAKKTKARHEAMKVQALVKQFFELKQFRPVPPEAFYPPFGTK